MYTSWVLKFPFSHFPQIYDETDLQRAKLELLSSTNMVDFAMDIHTSLYPDQVVPAELPERRSRVVSELKRLQVSRLQARNHHKRGKEGKGKQN